MNWLEISAVLLALLYVVLAIRERRACWPVGALSAALYLVVFAQADLYMESGLQMFYILMSLYGWFHWEGAKGRELAITSWAPIHHLGALAGLIVASAIVGAALSHWTNAAMPFLDSFTTVAALFTTWLVARKVLENWLYWVLIDLLSIYLFASRGLLLSAALFGGYVLLALGGYATWRQHWLQHLQQRERQHERQQHAA